MKYLTYEDCGMLGGRITLKCGTEYFLLEGSTPKDFATVMLYRMRESAEQRQPGFQFQRLAVVMLLLDGSILYVYCDENDAEEHTSSYETELPGDYENLTTIRDFIWFHGIQEYNILQQTSANAIRVLDRECPEDENQYEGPSYERFRCLDIMGPCNLTLLEEELSFHNYQKFLLGEDFYLEAMDNYIIGDREFWMGREYQKVKHLVATYDLEDEDYLGFYDEDHRLMIDQNMAAVIAELSDPHELFCIDNDYNLKVHAVDIGDGFFDEAPGEE
ncbi:MAG: hypothetical protein II845_08445 [Oscillospiraceae bacterium]|nr:hypothetical protein [Oscillospiraceae bacterium]